MDNESHGNVLRSSLLMISSIAFAGIFGAVSRIAVAQGVNTAQGAGMVDPSQSLKWQPKAIAHSQAMPIQRRRQRRQVGAADIPRFELDADPSGALHGVEDFYLLLDAS